MCNCARVLYRIDLHGWARYVSFGEWLGPGMTKAWAAEPGGHRPWSRSGRAVRWVGRERAGPGGERKGEKRVKAEEKAGKGSETMSRVARSD
jgi:hypothetical protein